MAIVTTVHLSFIVSADEENADDDYSSIKDWQKEVSYQEISDFRFSRHRVAAKNVSCPVAHVTQAEKDRQTAALRPFNITELKKRAKRHPELKPMKLTANGETDSHYRSPEASSWSGKSAQLHGQQRGKRYSSVIVSASVPAWSVRKPSV